MILKKDLQMELNRTKLVLDYAREEIKEKDKKIERLNNRIEKAVEYIKNDDNFWVALGEDIGKPNDDLDKLLNILSGRSDE